MDEENAVRQAIVNEQIVKIVRITFGASNDAAGAALCGKRLARLFYGYQAPLLEELRYEKTATAVAVSRYQRAEARIAELEAKLKGE